MFGIYKPKVYITQKEPSTIEEALQHEHWKAKMNKEYMALLRNATSSLESLPTNRKVIGCQWVFKIKENSNWTIQNYKAQLVVKGFY